VICDDDSRLDRDPDLDHPSGGPYSQKLNTSCCVAGRPQIPRLVGGGHKGWVRWVLRVHLICMVGI
jgi:hypothetical protein